MQTRLKQKQNRTPLPAIPEVSKQLHAFARACFAANKREWMCSGIRERWSIVEMASAPEFLAPQDQFNSDR
jgi:hypothetical protein